MSKWKQAERQLRVISTTKRNKIEQVKNWINKLTAFDGYGSQMLKLYNGDELDNMTLKQIDMILAYIKVCYHVGFQECSKLKKEYI